jgi:hypothetical protein
MLAQNWAGLEDLVLVATGWGNKRAKTDEWLITRPISRPKARVAGGEKSRGRHRHYSIAGPRDPINSRTHEVCSAPPLDRRNCPSQESSPCRSLSVHVLPINRRPPGAFCRPVAVVR